MSPVAEFLSAVYVMAFYALVLILYLLVFCALPAAIVVGVAELIARVRRGDAGERPGDGDGPA